MICSLKFSICRLQFLFAEQFVHAKTLLSSRNFADELKIIFRSGSISSLKLFWRIEVLRTSWKVIFAILINFFGRKFTDEWKFSGDGWKHFRRRRLNFWICFQTFSIFQPQNFNCGKVRRWKKVLVDRNIRRKNSVAHKVSPTKKFGILESLENFSRTKSHTQNFRWRWTWADENLGQRKVCRREK